MKRSRIVALMRSLDSTLTKQQVLELAAWSLALRGERFLGRLEDRLKGGEVVASAWGVLREWQEGGCAAPPLSPSKLLQTWSALCRRSAQAVELAGDEDGPYCVRERSWDTPCWDRDALRRELDAIAADMLGLIDDVFAEGGAAVSPFDFHALDAARAALPEWMGEMENDAPDLGPNVTWVALRWEWLVARGDAAAFVATVADIDETFAGCSPEADAVRRFAVELAEPFRTALFEALSSRRPVPALWESPFRELARVYDPGLWLDECRRGLARDWSLGAPVLEDCLRRGDWKAADATARQMLCSYLRTPDFDLDEALLIRRVRWQGNTEPLSTLLRGWQQAALQLADKPFAGVLEVQITGLERGQNWDAMMEALGKCTAPGLTEDWIRWVEEAHVGRRRSWVRTLLEHGCQGQAPEKTAEALGHELSSVPEDADVETLRPWMLLTGDVLSLSSAESSYPGLMAVCLERKVESHLDSRRRRLSRLDIEALAEAVLGFWRDRCERLVPDPSRFTAQYQQCVGWLGALADVDQGGFDRVLDAWQAKHRNRKNLWAELNAAGLARYGRCSRTEPPRVLWRKGQ